MRLFLAVGHNNKILNLMCTQFMFKYTYQYFFFQNLQILDRTSFIKYLDTIKGIKITLLKKPVKAILLFYKLARKV